MNTDDLIAMLATGTPPVDPRLPEKRFRTALLAGWAGAALIVLTGYGLRTDLAQASLDPMLWVKFLFPALLGVTALRMTLRLSRPGMGTGQLHWALVLPVVGMALLCVLVLAQASPEQRLPLVLGLTWKACAISIALVATPTFAASFWALKDLAPTRPALAGASAGLLAGASGAFVYAFHCPEMAAPFIAVWNTLGMLVPVALGAVLGPRLLRW
jgi:hypothetical protein